MSAILKFRRAAVVPSLFVAEPFYDQTLETLRIGTAISGSSVEYITLIKLNDQNIGSLDLTGDVTASSFHVSGGNGEGVLLDDGTVIPSASLQTFLPDGLVSGSSQVTSSLDTRYELQGTGIVSSSDQISSSFELRGSGIVSGSTQLTSSFDSRYELQGSGIVSSSDQVSSSFELRGSGIVSGSTQLTSSLDTRYELRGIGIVSGSSQIDLTQVTNYVSGIKTRLDAETVISSSSQLTSSFVQKSGDTVNGDIIIAGNLTVNGNTTYISSSVLDIGDNIINLNFGGSAVFGGIYVRDVTPASTVSGSLLWDGTNDYWIAGISGSESKILLANGDGVVSGSSQITFNGLSGLPSGLVSGSSQIDLTQTTNYVSGIKTRLDVETVVSGSSQIDLTQVTNYISGIKTRLDAEQVYSGSLNIVDDTSPQLGGNLDMNTNDIIGTGNILITGSIEATGEIEAFAASDERLKLEMRPIENPLEKLEKITGYTYKWDEEKQEFHKGEDVGVSAQEIKEILPPLVRTNDNGYLAVKYEKIVALLIESNKALHNEVKELKKRMDDYDADNTAIKGRE